ncbi:hypothetical protein BDBG_00884 [Blastomyces gilchristii SLH14081]|uniref:Uncharacterized protein n=1 Tax=Blastomyces gilchristii (strain SLH14081) TaxID=559298 RepID=A0A179U8I6_BLAGS|nr:uncharacterized protein BDBG_00884 [Blastomyces gilchristii SLH14081]OAT04305.1 hypothetical protein BDBG_00884 [Blastomyces gilchristii SLH14081]
MLIEKRDSVAIVMREVENEPDTDKPAGRRDNTSLQGTATTAVTAREAEEREDVIMKVMLLQLIDTAVFIFNLAFLTVTETAAAS